MFGQRRRAGSGPCPRCSALGNVKGIGSPFWWRFWALSCWIWGGWARGLVFWVLGLGLWVSFVVWGDGHKGMWQMSSGAFWNVLHMTLEYPRFCPRTASCERRCQPHRLQASLPRR